MRVIYSGRKTSRTTTLIHECAEAQKRGELSYIVVGNHEQAYSIAQKAIELGLVIAFPLTFHEFLQGRYAGRNISNFYIDNADHLLQYLSRAVPIRIVTMERREEDDPHV